jgi:hypothetical protein
MSIENTDEESFTPEQADQPQQPRKKPEAEMGLDLDLHFLPAWAQQGANAKLYENFTGDEGGGERRERRGPRRDFGGGGGGNRDRGPRRDRPRPEGGRPGFGQGGGGFQGQRPGGGPRGDRREGGRFGRGGPRRDQRDQGGRPPQDRPQIKLPDLEVSFIPEDKGVESLARQIKLSGRAYPLFEIAYLVLKKPERYHVQLISKKKEDATPIQPLFICALDDTLWLDENEAMQHVLDKHFGTFYASEKIPTDPPKGVYTFVAQCGMSGTILGPPNYHDYQNKLRKLHQERFARMPFDMFKSRIRIVKDEAVVKKWLEEQSFRTEYTALNVPETIKFNSREEVEKHFRETHLANVIKSVDTFTLAGTDVADVQNRGLQALMRRSYDEQMRFPLKVVNILSGQFARQGLQFFKVNKSVTHVAVARPRYLDMEATPVSEGVKKIVDFINGNPRSTRKKLLEALAPGSSFTPGASITAAPATAAPVEGQSAEAAPVAEPAVPTAAQAVISDLHWLIHQGHVIEFANGILETAKKPLPRPPRPERQPKAAEQGALAEQGTEHHAEAEVTTQEGVVAGEGAAAETAGAPPAEQPAEGAIPHDESGTPAGGEIPGAETPAPEPVAEANKA